MPSSEPDLCYLTASEALKLFAKRDLSPVELMQAILRRIEFANPKVNALGDCFFDEAIAGARRAEARWIDGTARPLEGIPLAVKDAQHVAGQRTTYGSPLYRENFAQVSDPMIARLEAAGAIIHARTTVSEFCISGVCFSTMWGRTCNPWNLTYSPGGSSGGSGAALAAGMTTLATGTDMGGSIRIPASACGVVGFKPPHGRNPDGPLLNVDRFGACGPLARCALDICLVQNVVAGQDPGDHDSLREKPRYPESLEEIAGLRVAWSLDLGYRAVHPDVQVNTERAIALLRDLGCRVEAVELNWNEEIDRLASDWYRLAPAGHMLASAVAQAPDLVSAELVRMVRSWPADAPGITPVLALVHRMARDFANVMARHDVFVCPTMSVPAVRADQSMWDENFEIAGKKVDPEFGYSMTHQFNLLGNCPVISVPSGLSRDGAPTGIQIVGRPFDDLAVIRAALAFEAAGKVWYSGSGLRPKF
jgi:amidase